MATPHHVPGSRPMRRSGQDSTPSWVAHNGGSAGAAQPNPFLGTVESSLAEDPSQEPVLPVVKLLIVAVLVFLGLTALVLWVFHA